MPTAEELRLRVHPGLTAATTFKSARHPRGRDGRFIEVGALIRFFEGTSQGTGKVTDITEGDNGSAIVHVEDTAGRPHTLRPDQVSEAKRVKGRLGKAIDKLLSPKPPDTAGPQKAAEDVRRAAESNVDVEERKDALRKRVHQNLAEREQATGVIPGVSSGSGTKDDPYIVSDVDKAAELLGEGKHIQMAQPDEVATLLDKLKEIVDDARSKGETAPNYDLCKVSVPKTNLFCVESKHIPRNHMPQLSGVPTPGSEADKLPRVMKKDKVTGEMVQSNEVDLSQQFVDFLASRNISVTDEKKMASHLRASQNQLEGGKVAGMANALQAGKLPPGAIFVTRDGYIVDGHHRWAANVGVQYKTGQDMEMDVRTIDADILQVLAIADNFSDSLGIPKASVSGEKTNPVADEAARATEQGGSTFQPMAGGKGIIQPKAGFVVAVDPADNHPGVIPADVAKDRTKLKAAMAKWLDEAAPAQAKNPDYHFGTWVDPDTGIVYFDIVEVMQDRAKAEAAGRDRNQIAIWDLANQAEIKTGGSGDVAVAAGGNDERYPDPEPSPGQGLRVPAVGDDDAGGEGRLPGQAGRRVPSPGGQPEPEPTDLVASASALLAGGSTMKAESPYLTEDGMSWNGEALPDTVKAALTAPMGKVSSPGAAEALNALYQSLVLNTGGGQVPLDSLIAQVTELDKVAEADGTDGGDAKALQKASKLVRTLFAIPDQADLDRAQERANSKAKSMGKPKAAAPKEGGEAEAEKAEPTPDAETPADAASEAAVPATAPAGGGGDAEALRKRVHV